MFVWFEKWLDFYFFEVFKMLFGGFVSFMLYFMCGVWGYMLLMVVCLVLIVICEVILFGYLGLLVDWLVGVDCVVFWVIEGMCLLLMGVILMIVLFVLQIVFLLLMYQMLMGNLLQCICWQVYCYLLCQLMSYFQDEFVGCIVIKLMQIVLVVCEVVMKFMDVLVYVGVYFIGVLIFVVLIDGWLVLLFVGWGLGYGLLLWWLILCIGCISEVQVDVCVVMIGCVVDSYINIIMVKFFLYFLCEEVYVCESMDGFLGMVYGQMCLVLVQNIMLFMLNFGLVFVVMVLGLWLWIGGCVEVGVVVIVILLVLWLGNMLYWIMWEFVGLFENIGMVCDGIGLLLLLCMVVDVFVVKVLVVLKGVVEFQNVIFCYGESFEGWFIVVLDDLSLLIVLGECIGLVGWLGVGKFMLVNLMLWFYDLELGCILIDGQDIFGVMQESLCVVIGVVMQDILLLYRFICDNIVYG